MRHVKTLLFFLTIGIGEISFAQNYSFQLSGSWCRRLEIINDTFADYADYREGLLSGPGLLAEFDFLFNNHGLGFRYNHFSTKSSAKQIYVPNYGTNDISDRIVVNYIGVQYTHNFRIKKSKWFIVSNGGVGYILYSSNQKFGEVKEPYSNHTIGFEGNLGIDYRVKKYLSVGLKLGLMIAAINSDLKSTDGTSTQSTTTQTSSSTTVIQAEDKISLSRIDGMIGCTFFF